MDKQKYANNYHLVNSIVNKHIGSISDLSDIFSIISSDPQSYDI